jgi:hypothetical protein
MKVHLYKTYSFKDKDPVIDTLRTAFQDGKHEIIELSAQSGVSPTCIYNWFYGPTKRPQHATVMAVARAMRCDFIFKKAGKSAQVLPMRRKQA